MGNKIIIILAIFFTCGIVSAWEIEDVNGTWAYDDEALADFSLPVRNYSWGKGRTIPNSSIDLDLERKEVRLSGMGLYIIEKVFEGEEGSICLELFSVGDESRSSPLQMKISFIDFKSAYIVCYPQTGWSDRSLSPEEKWIWYRLSGPGGK